MNTSTEDFMSTELSSNVSDEMTSSFTDMSSVTDGSTLATTTHIYSTYSVFIHPHWYQFPLISPGWHYLIGCFITVVGISGVLGNALVIYMFSKVPTLRTPSNMYIVNLAISDMTFSFVNGFPLLTLSSFSKKWIFGQAACEFYGLIGAIFGLMSINTMATIALDRYYAIARPLDVARNMTRKRSFMMIVVVWLWSLASSLPPIFGWGRYIPEGFQTSCTFDYLTRTNNNRTYIFFLYIFGFVGPLGVILVCYALILKAINKHEKEMKNTAKKLNAEMRSNQDKQSMEIRVAKVAMAVVLQYLISWTPYATIALIGQFGDASFVTPFWSEIPVMFAKASAMHNPLLYALSHPKFRDALNKHMPWVLICCKPKPKPNLTTGTANDASTKRGLSSQASVSSVTSVISNASDTMYADMEIRLRKLEQETTTNNLRAINMADPDSGKIIQDLTKVLLEVSSRDRTNQDVKPVYIPNSILKQKAGDGKDTGDSDGVFVLDNNTLPGLASYLAQFSKLNGGVYNPALEMKPEKADSEENNAAVIDSAHDNGARPKTNNLNINTESAPTTTEEHRL